MPENYENDDLILIVASSDDGRTVNRVGWAEARGRLAEFLRQPTEPVGWGEQEAEVSLQAMFTGREDSTDA